MPRAPFQVFVYPFRQDSAEILYAMFRRTDEGYWQSIAGGGEDDESFIEAAKREALEEANIPDTTRYFQLTTTVYVPVYHFRARHLWSEDRYVIPGYCFAVDASDVEIVLSREHSEYKWVDYETAQNSLHWDSDKTALWELNERLLNDDLPLPV